MSIEGELWKPVLEYNAESAAKASKYMNDAFDYLKTKGMEKKQEEIEQLRTEQKQIINETIKMFADAKEKGDVAEMELVFMGIMDALTIIYEEQLKTHEFIQGMTNGL